MNHCLPHLLPQGPPKPRLRLKNPLSKNMPSKEANEKTYPSLVVFYYFDPPKIKKGEGMVMYSVINTRIGIVSLPLQSIILVR